MLEETDIVKITAPSDCAPQTTLMHVDVAKRHARHAKWRSTSPNAMPATQSESRYRQVPRLPRQQPRRPRRQTRTKRATRASPSAKSATPATQNARRCRQVPRLPRKVKVDVCEQVVCVCE